MRRYLICLLFVVILVQPGYSSGKVTIAVLDLAPNGVSRMISRAVSDIIRSEFVNIGNFTVVERSQINMILKEQGFQMTGCTDSTCAVKYGKILSARRIVVGEINSIGRTAIITIRYINVENGNNLFSAMEKVSSIDELDKAAETIAKNLARKIVSGDKEILTPVTKTGYYGRGFIPGWGQFYVGNKVKGYLFMVLSAASITYVGYSYYDYTSKQKMYSKLTATDSVHEFDSKAKDADDAAQSLNNSILGFLAIYMINWVDLIFFNDHENVIAGSRYHQKQFYVVLDTRKNVRITDESIIDLSFNLKF